MPEINNPTPPKEDIVALIKEYITTKAELTRLTVIEKLTTLISSLIADVIVVSAALLTFFFASLALGFYLGQLLNSYGAGFGIVALLYLAIALIINYKKKRSTLFLNDFLIKKIFSKNNTDDGKEL